MTNLNDTWVQTSVTRAHRQVNTVQRAISSAGYPLKKYGLQNTNENELAKNTRLTIDALTM